MIDAFLERLYAEGTSNDAGATNRTEMMLNITPSTGRFLDLMIRDSRPRRILELGTSNGYSTIWIGRAAANMQCDVDSVDCAAAKTEAAENNLRQVGLQANVALHTCDAAEFLARCEADRYEFVFLDSARDRYTDWLDDLMRVTSLGTIVVDNAISHAAEMSEFIRRLGALAEILFCVLPIGNGQLVIRPRIAGSR